MPVALLTAAGPIRIVGGRRIDSDGPACGVALGRSVVHFPGDWGRPRGACPGPLGFGSTLAESQIFWISVR